MNWIPGCAFILTALLVASHGDQCECPCPNLPPQPLTEADAAQDCCRNGSRHRYRCVAGYSRKAGTSNLAKCTNTKDEGQKWSTATDIICISDPRMASTSGPDAVPGTRMKATRIIRATEPATYQTAEQSTANQGIGQPNYHTTDQSGAASYGPAMAPTHADAPTRPPSGSASTLATPSPAQGTPRDDEVLQADPVQKSDPADWTQGHSSEESSGALLPAGLSIMLLLIVCTSVGLGYGLWKRKMKNNGTPERTPEEETPMTTVAQTHRPTATS